MERGGAVEVSQGNPVWALGLMSGTSMDGVDAALVLTDGETIVEFGPAAGSAYAPGDTTFTTGVFHDWRPYRPPRGDGFATELAEAENEVVANHASAVVRLLARRPEVPAVIGFHGQTIAHMPDEGWTWQLGDGAVLAHALNRPVVWDFRSDDMQAGGQGAPLAPFYHFALAQVIGATEPLAFLNIGGVGNVTWIDPGKSAPEAAGALVAFDTGPGNALINDWMLKRTGKPVDADGAAAAEGEVDWMTVHSNAAGAFFERPAPKSLDRNEFALVLDRISDFGTEDGAATLTALTVEAIGESLRHMPSPPARWLVCGGGRKNATMMRMLGERLGAPVEPVEAVGLDGDMLEAQAFAYLAVRVLRGLPTSAPGTTGCRAPVSGGRISYP